LQSELQLQEQRIAAEKKDRDDRAPLAPCSLLSVGRIRGLTAAELELLRQVARGAVRTFASISGPGTPAGHAISLNRRTDVAVQAAVQLNPELRRLPDREILLPSLSARPTEVEASWRSSPSQRAGRRGRSESGTKFVEEGAATALAAMQKLEGRAGD